jgi:hypothetical protein
MFQHTLAQKEETRKMLDSINFAINPSEPVKLDRIFNKMWPDMEDAIKGMPAAESQVPSPIPERVMISEILDIVRSLQPRNEKPTAYDLASFLSQQPNRLALLSQLWQAKDKDIRRELTIPEELWVKSAPACPACGMSTGPVLLPDSKKRTCTNCGAVNDVSKKVGKV